MSKAKKFFYTNVSDQVLSEVESHPTEERDARQVASTHNLSLRRAEIAIALVRVREMSRSGLEVKQIAASLGLSNGAIERMRSRLGVGKYLTKRAPIPPRRILKNTSIDREFKWVRDACILHKEEPSSLEQWRMLAAEYITSIDRQRTGKGIQARLMAIRLFLEHYLLKHRYFDPLWFFTLPKETVVPPLYGPTRDVAPFFIGKDGGQTAYKNTNRCYDFCEWAMYQIANSEEDGSVVLPPNAHVPFDKVNGMGASLRSQSIRSVLPYKYILDLRELLAPGAHFKDWNWAQTETVAGGDWFEVPKDLIDKNDPDCVWRLSKRQQLNSQLEKPIPNKSPRTVVGEYDCYEIWSPVTAVALLVKLTMPFRTFQVRMLDSGETDVRNAELDPHSEMEFLERRGDWASSTKTKSSPLFVWKENTDRKVLLDRLNLNDQVRVRPEQGVFYPYRAGRSPHDSVGFFVNTNKTADINKDWHLRGYRVPYQDDILLRWMVKLRNWQKKYNPIASPTLWEDMAKKHLGFTKGSAELAAANPTCFLFRNAAAQDLSDRDKPIHDGKIDVLWIKLLDELELREKQLSNHDADGEYFKFIKSRRDKKANWTTFYPLHSLRVSIITALGNEGGVDLRTLMELAGHSRIVMTIYYQKINPLMMSEVMEKAQRLLVERADAQFTQLMKSAQYEAILKHSIANEGALRMALPADVTARNAINWERVLGGWCMVGGNATRTEDSQVGGCYNGGEQLDSPDLKRPQYQPVDRRRCIQGNCRWFITRPEYLQEVADRMVTTLTAFTTARQLMIEAEDAWEALRQEKSRCSLNGTPFLHHSKEKQAANLTEKRAADVEKLGIGIAHTATLLERMRKLACRRNNEDEPSQLIATGSLKDVETALARVDLEMMTSAGINPKTEVHTVDSAGLKTRPTSELELQREQLIAQMQDLTTTWGLAEGSELMQLTAACLAAQRSPELEGEAETAIYRRSQLLDTIFQREKVGLSLSSSGNASEQLRLGNRLLTHLAKTMQGGMEKLIELLDSGVPLPQEILAALSSGNPTTLPVQVAKLLT